MASAVHPQLGDTVSFFRQGYFEYLRSQFYFGGKSDPGASRGRKRKVSKLREKVLADWGSISDSLTETELCRVVKIEYIVDNPAKARLTLALLNHPVVNPHVTGANLTAVSNWQNARRAQPLTGDVRITMAFNGVGTTERLLARGRSERHADWRLHECAPARYPDVRCSAVAAELLLGEPHVQSRKPRRHSLCCSERGAHTERRRRNGYWASPTTRSRFLVQPDVSGLGNANFLRAAYDHGLRYLLSGTRTLCCASI